MASRKIKKELLKAFPMFYFRVRTLPGDGHMINVVKGPVDFGNYNRTTRFKTAIGHPSTKLYNKISAHFDIGVDEGILLGLMLQHVFQTVEGVSGLCIHLGLREKLLTHVVDDYNDYVLTDISQSTILIDNGDGSKSYRGYDFKRGPGIKWKLYYDNKQVMYNSMSLRRPLGHSISAFNVKEMKVIIDSMCNTSIPDIRMKRESHLFYIEATNSWEYMRIPFHRDTLGGYYIELGTDEPKYVNNLANAVKAIDNYMIKD